MVEDNSSAEADALDEIQQEIGRVVTIEQASARYEALVALWTHRDATMHQWPPLIITAAGALLALIFSQRTRADLSAILSPENWGFTHHAHEIWLGTGVPLLIGGLAVMPFLYGMTRAIIIMDNMTRGMEELERQWLGCDAQHTFAHYNHPGGWSSRRLILRMMGFVAFGLTMAGSLVTFGLILGGVVYLAIVVVGYMYYHSDRYVRHAREQSILESPGTKENA